MESALRLAVLAVVTAVALPTAVADMHYPSYKYPYEESVPESLPIAQNDDSVYYALPEFRSGDAACDRHITLNANDVISQKFYEDHICLIRRDPPKDLPAFCRDFRKGQPIYQVMLLTTKDISRLRRDLQGHQNDFYNQRGAFRPLFRGPGMIHYTTDGTYNFIYCEESRGRWIGRIYRNRYQQYIPHGTEGNPRGVYKIYHGCPPVVTRPQFSLPGSC